jgi:symplekin
MKIIKRIIMKKVWKKKKVWEGLIKWCKRKKKKSLKVLIKINNNKISDVLKK